MAKGRKPTLGGCGSETGSGKESVGPGLGDVTGWDITKGNPDLRPRNS